MLSFISNQILYLINLIDLDQLSLKMGGQIQKSVLGEKEKNLVSFNSRLASLFPPPPSPTQFLNVNTFILDLLPKVLTEASRTDSSNHR